jgi:hypothetical protein
VRAQLPSPSDAYVARTTERLDVLLAQACAGFSLARLLRGSMDVAASVPSLLSPPQRGWTPGHLRDYSSVVGYVRTRSWARGEAPRHFAPCRADMTARIFIRSLSNMDDLHLGSPALPLPSRLGALRGTSTGASTPGLGESALGGGPLGTRLELLARVAANRVMLDRMEQAVLRVGVRLPPVEVGLAPMLVSARHRSDRCIPMG